MTEAEVRRLLKAAAKPSLRQWATKMKVQASIVSEVINGRRDATPAVLKALGLRRRTIIEAIPPRPPKTAKAGE